MGKWIAAMALAALATSAAAKEPKAASRTAEPLRPLEACRAIADAGERLACFDAAASRLNDAVARKEVVVMDQQEIKETRRSLFGFSLPRLPLFRGDSGGEVDELESTIASVSSLGMGKWRIRLPDGAVWQTTDSIGFGSDPKAGQKIVIKRGTLGNYFLRIDGRNGVRGKRES
jgi:hypothetical protein